MLVAVLVLLMTAWVVLGRQLMQLVPNYRHDLEQLVEARINTPLEIGALSGYMDGASPVFVFDNVRLPSAGESAPLHINRVELTVDVLASVTSRTLRARQLRVSGIDLHLSISPEGKVQLTGLDGLGSAAGSNRKPPLDTLLDLIYRQKRLVVEDARGVLSLADLPDIEVADLAVAVVSSGSRHRLSLKARTADRPVEVDVRVVVDGDAHSLAELNGDAWVHIQAAEADPWINAVLAGRAHIADLNGSAQFWLSVQQGQLRRASAELAFDAVSVDAPSMSTPLQLQGLSLQAGLRKQASDYVLQLARLTIQQPQHALHLGPVAAAWNGHTDDQLAWRVAARDLDITAARAWAVGLPVKWQPAQQAILDRMMQLKPAGELEALFARGGRGVDAFSARFEALSSNAHEKFPGVSGVSGWAAGDLSAGTLMLDSDALALNLPLLFRAPMQMQASGPVRWQRDADNAAVLQTGWLRVRNEDAHGRAVAEVNLVPEQMPRLSLIASLSDGNAHAAPRYIPLKRLPEPVSDWLSSAFVSGRVDRGAFIYEGPVKINPDRQQDRTLQVAILGRDLQLHFLPGWPLVRGLNVDAVIDGREIRGRDISGRIFSSRLDHASADIPSYITGEAPELVIYSNVAGPANDLQRLLQETPLREKLPEELADWQVGVGQMRGNALLYVPLGASDNSMQVLVNAGLKSTEISNAERRLALNDINGSTYFSLSDGLQAPQLQASLWGQPVTASVSSQKQKTSLQFSGSQPVSAVSDWLEAKWLRAASGTLSYRAAMNLPGDSADVELNVDADLKDVALALPAPLARKPGKPLSGTLRLTANADVQDLSIQLGSLLDGKMRLVAGQVERGQFVLNERNAKMPMQPGVWVTGTVPTLKVTDWIEYFSATSGDELGDKPFPLSKVSLQTSRLNLFDLGIDDALIQVVPESTEWRYMVDSDQLAGHALVPDGYQPRGAVPMTIAVQHLFIDSETNLPAADENQPAPELLDINPNDMPIADVSIDTVVMDDEDYGQWNFKLRPAPEGAQVSAIQGLIRTAQVSGTIDWSKTKTSVTSHFIGRVESRDVSSMLKQWDFPPVLESDKMRSILDVSWAGSPLDFDPLAMRGKASLEIGESRFPKTDSKTSALRVLGVFNLGTVSRRLRLDFTDLYKKGLICDSIGGDFEVDGPLLTTGNLVIKSPSAEFRIKGQVDMNTTELNHQVEVTLPVSSNLYVGCLAGPTACAGIFVVERLWGNKLEKMTTLGYQVTGSWEDPKVEEVQGIFERKK